eukprot:100728_1
MSSYNRRCCKCCKCSGTDKVAAVLIISIVITVGIALSIAIVAELVEDAMRHSVCHWVIDYNDTIDICGNETAQHVSTSEDCIDECKLMHTDELSAVYYINSTAFDTDRTCYCLSDSQWNQINTEDDDQSQYDQYCFEFANVSDSELNKYIKQCPFRGRPYFQSNKYLLSDVTHIPCVEYRYYANNQWKSFVTNHQKLHNNTQNNEIMNEWIEQGLAEHASIASFSRFSLELMSIGAPLWMIQLSNKAGLEEIKHTQISFDIANWYLHGMYQDRTCVTPNVFPQHSVNINADWNRIASDTAIGGCLGETTAALTMRTQMYGNMIDDYIDEIAMEEVRHAALAWVAVKWMIDHVSDDVHMDVGSRYWWQYQIENGKQRVSGVDGMYVYEHVIPLILEQMWVVEDYKEFYGFVVRTIPHMAQSNECDNICTFFSFGGSV